jgi:hypothetical protein
VETLERMAQLRLDTAHGQEQMREQIAALLKEAK